MMWTADKIYYQGSSAFTRAYQGSELVWINNYLTPMYMTAQAANTTIKLALKSSYQTVEYSTDGGNIWSNMTTTTTINLASGNTVYFRGILTTANSTSRYTQFKFTGKVKIGGNINYFWNYQNPNEALKDYCGYSMFNNNTSITDASELVLPATTLATSCYHNMFASCYALTKVTSILPATTLTTACYRSMFQNCTSLTEVPELPSTGLTNNCYRQYAQNTAIRITPNLPATMLDVDCYRSMFKDCTYLTTAPDLPAATLAQSCYQYMFSGCSQLNYIKCLATNTGATDCTTQWVAGVASSGTFVKDETMTGWTIDSVNGIPIGWTVVDGDYLRFTAKANNSSISLDTKATGHTIEYSTNGNVWNNMTTATTINLSSGQSVFVRGVLNDDYQYTTTNFKMSGNIKLAGNINYLWNKNNPDAPIKERCGYNLFHNCTALTDASELKLPATTLANNCYKYMFNWCTSLTAAPELPATTLANYCYEGMFEGCSSLQTAPDLLAPTLVGGCYMFMFSNCTNLNYIKCMANNDPSGCTNSWVSGVAASGTFIKPSGNNYWKYYGSSWVPSGWTVIDE